MTLYLSRLQLSRNPQQDALKAILDPDTVGQRQDAHHRLIWSAFAGDPDAKRDFLWRAEGRGNFLVLSARPPVDSPFFEPAQVKVFDLQLAAGDRLAFALRANATRSRAGQRVDIVMDALHGIAQPERAAKRMALAQQAADDWMQSQGARHGFTLRALAVEDYAPVALPSHRGPRKGQPQFGILDMTGLIEVTDPTAFLTAVAAGFGRAKAFGCGLMLIRRA